jgi:hypothetical protein
VLSTSRPSLGHQYHGLQSVQLVAEHLALVSKGNLLLHRRPEPKELALSWLLSSSDGERAAVRKRRHQGERGSKQDLNQPGGKIIHWVGSRVEAKRSNPPSTGKACWHLG